jgi:transposase
MPKPYSNDLRERLVAAVMGGLSRHKAAAQFKVAPSTAINWMKRVQETGSVEPGQMGGHRPRTIQGEHENWLAARIRERAFTLRGLVAELAERGLDADYCARARADTQKKTLVASEQSRPDVARRRDQWLKHQSSIDADRLVFIDETWVKTNMAPLRGWAPCGTRLKASAPFGHWNTTTFLAALRNDRIEAPWLLDGPINGERFRVYVEHVLAPTLSPGDIVVMDNLGSHKSKAVRRAIRRAGAKLFFMPKYSPDLNPIEQLFAKLKHHLRAAQQRTRDTLSDAVAQILAAVTSHECSNYLRHAGYGQT